MNLWAIKTTFCQCKIRKAVTRMMLRHVERKGKEISILARLPNMSPAVFAFSDTAADILESVGSL